MQLNDQTTICLAALASRFYPERETRPVTEEDKVLKQIQMSMSPAELDVLRLLYWSERRSESVELSPKEVNALKIISERISPHKSLFVPSELKALSKSTKAPFLNGLPPVLIEPVAGDNEWF